MGTRPLFATQPHLGEGGDDQVFPVSVGSKERVRVGVGMGAWGRGSGLTHRSLAMEELRDMPLGDRS